MDNQNNGGTLTPAKLELDIYPKRGTETSGLSQVTRPEVKRDEKWVKQTNRNPYGQVITEQASYEQTEIVDAHDKKQNSIMKEDEVERNKNEPFSPEHIQELREGTTFKEVQRTVESFNLFDDSSGFVSSEEFMIV